MKTEYLWTAFALILLILSYFAGHSDGFYDGADYICNETLFLTEYGEIICLVDQTQNLNNNMEYIIP